MTKRFVRIDIEYDDPFSTGMISHVASNIRQIISKDMPYARIIFTRDTPKLEELNDSNRLTKD